MTPSARPYGDGRLGGEGAWGADLRIEGAEELHGEVARLRRVLDPDAIERLRHVGADAVAAIEEVAGTVGADERITRFRHPLPAGAPIERRALLAVSAERGGLYANVTRIVELEPPSEDLQRRLAACREILRRMREEATTP